MERTSSDYFVLEIAALLLVLLQLYHVAVLLASRLDQLLLLLLQLYHLFESPTALLEVFFPFASFLLLLQHQIVDVHDHDPSSFQIDYNVIINLVVASMFMK